MCPEIGEQQHHPVPVRFQAGHFLLPESIPYIGNGIFRKNALVGVLKFIREVSLTRIVFH